MKKILLGLFLAIILVPGMALAADIRASQSGMESVGKNETVQNLYAAGNTVNIDGTIKGDAVMAGANLNVTGKVENSLMATGANLQVGGEVGNSARLAGSNITLSGKVGQDVMIAGNAIRISNQSQIGQDAFLVGNDIQLDGSINGKLNIAGANMVRINGTVNNDVNINRVATLVIGDSAVINGKLTYSSAKQAQVSSSATIKNGIAFNEIKTQETGTAVAGFLTLALLLKLLIGFVTLLALIYLLPRLARDSAATVFAKPWMSLGWGLVTLIIVPFVALILLLTVIGAKLTGLLMAVYIPVLIFAGVYIPVIVGSLIFSRGRLDRPRVDWLTVLVGILVTFIISLIPFIGPLVLFILFLFSLGAMVIMMFDHLKSWQKVEKADIRPERTKSRK